MASLLSSLLKTKSRKHVFCFFFSKTNVRCARAPVKKRKRGILFLLGEQGSRKFRQELGRAVQAQSKIDPDTDALREVVEGAMALMPDEALDQPVGDPPEDALGVQAVED